MASFSFSVDVVKRSEGRSAVSAAAYQSRAQLHDARLGKLTKNYKKRGGLVSEFIMANAYTAKIEPWVLNRTKLWNAAEAAETRKNSQVARTVVLALPHELSDEQREQMLRRFIKDNFVDYGMIADVAIHRPDIKGDHRNHHAHIMLTMRKFGTSGFSENKCREWNYKSNVERWRKAWCDATVIALGEAGFAKEAKNFRNSHLSLIEQRKIALANGDAEKAAALDRKPGRHKGPALTAKERREEEVAAQATTASAFAENWRNEAEVFTVDQVNSIHHPVIETIGITEATIVLGQSSTERPNRNPQHCHVLSPAEAFAAASRPSMVQNERNPSRRDRDFRAAAAHEAVTRRVPVKKEYSEATKAKMLAKEKATQEINHLWKQIEDASDFIAAVNRRGYEVVKGDKRDILLIKDGNHWNLQRLVGDPCEAIGRKISRVVTEDIRDKFRMSSVNMGSLPSSGLERPRATSYHKRWHDALKAKQEVLMAQAPA